MTLVHRTQIVAEHDRVVRFCGKVLALSRHFQKCAGRDKDRVFHVDLAAVPQPVGQQDHPVRHHLVSDTDIHEEPGFQARLDDLQIGLGRGHEHASGSSLGYRTQPQAQRQIESSVPCRLGLVNRVASQGEYPTDDSHQTTSPIFVAPYRARQKKTKSSRERTMRYGTTRCANRFIPRTDEQVNQRKSCFDNRPAFLPHTASRQPGDFHASRVANLRQCRTPNSSALAPFLHTGNVQSSDCVGGVSCCVHTRTRFRRHAKPNASYRRALQLFAAPALEPRGRGFFRSRQRKNWRQEPAALCGQRLINYLASMSQARGRSLRWSAKSSDETNPRHPACNTKPLSYRPASLNLRDLECCGRGLSDGDKPRARAR
jgi:hypothetical protein